MNMNTKVQIYAEIIQTKQIYITENVKYIVDKCHQFGITYFYLVYYFRLRNFQLNLNVTSVAKSVCLKTTM